MTKYEQILRNSSEEAKRRRRSRSDAEESKDWKAKKIIKEALKAVMAEEADNNRETLS